MKTLFFALLLSLPLLSTAQSTEPILMLNTGMHTAKITRMDTDAAGRYVLTASEDKTAKLWSEATGKLLQTYRPPVGGDNDGLLWGAALAPSGNYVAVGSWVKSGEHRIYIFDAQSGILLDQIDELLKDRIFDLEFSPDGRYLAAALGGKQGIRIYRSGSWSKVAEDTDYGDRSYNVVFLPQGGLISVSYNGYLRRYDTDFRLVKKVRATGGQQLYSLAISPDGKLLAVGYNDSPTVQVLDANTLQLRYEPELGTASILNDRLDKLAFSSDGRQLIAGGFYAQKQSDGKWWRMIRIWNDRGRGSYRDYPATNNTVMDLKVLPNGNIAYCGTQPDWGILNPRTGERLVYHAPAINDHRSRNRSHFKLNEDGRGIGWTPVYTDPLTFDLTTRSLTAGTATYPAYQASAEGLMVTDWEDSYSPQLNGTPLSFLKPYERSRSIDIADHAQTVVFGADWQLYALDAAGERRWRTSLQSIAYGINVAGNGKVVAACQSDGTLRWYRMSDGELLLTLYVHPDRQRWVLWTPSGYYDASAGAEEFLGWHLNQGADSEALFYPVARFRDIYYRPDVIDRILDTRDEEQALQLADAAAGRSTARRSIQSELPPTVRILSPAPGARMGSDRIEVAYSIKSPADAPVTGVKFLIDGRPVAQERGLKPVGERHTVALALEGDCTVSIIAENRFGAGPEVSVDLLWAGRPPVVRKPNLYVLAVGVADYADDRYDLDFAAADAQAFAAVLKKQEGLLYNEVEVKLFTDQQATKDNILDGLDWLVRETTQHDVAMLFFAGHGVEDTRGTFYYLPTEADENAMRRTCLMEADIQETVAVVTGKIIVFMDACHSGNLMATGRRRGANPDVARIVNELIEAQNGAVVFSSSTGRQSSLENRDWGHGAFTKALVEGLGGRAVDEKGKVSCKSLDYYVSRRVKELTGGQQTPTTNYPPNVPDFPISIIR